MLILRPAPEGDTTTIGRTSSKNLMWSFEQMIAHHTLGGCPMRTGDLLGSGTISGTQPSERGSLLEMSEGGKKRRSCYTAWIRVSFSRTAIRSRFGVSRQRTAYASALEAAREGSIVHKKIGEKVKMRKYTQETKKLR